MQPHNNHHPHHAHGGKAVDIIKQRGRRPTESFQHDKLHRSIFAACVTAGTPDGQAEMLARRVTDHVFEWLQHHPEVTSEDVRRVAARWLRTHHPDAGYLYEQHRVIL